MERTREGEGVGTGAALTFPGKPAVAANLLLLLSNIISNKAMSCKFLVFARKELK